MGWGYGNIGGGSAGLNFKIAYYANAESLLADAPKENTIGVVTETAVPKWGFYAAMPETPAEGELCFQIGTESSYAFNALKKNALTVYPVACKQYISGAWVNTIAHIYKSGAWVQFSSLDLYIFKSGYGELIPLTKTKQQNSAVTSTNDSIVCQYWGEGYHRIEIKTSTRVDVSNFSELNVEANITGVKGSSDTDAHIGRFGLYDVSNYASVMYFTADKALKTYKLDISEITGEYFIEISDSVNGTIYNIWLE